MRRGILQAPDASTLQMGLTSVLNGNGHRQGTITILDRETVNKGTYPKEVVTCRLKDGRELRLFCKYTAAPEESYGHRGGAPYEAQVYRHVLQDLPLPRANYYGSYEDPVTGTTWIILEYLKESIRLNKARQPEAMLQASRWLGRFHAAYESRLSGSPLPFLNSYDAEYYLGWARRTHQFAGSLNQQFSWLQTLYRRFPETLPILLSGRTVIHGEYYPANVLYRGGNAYPVDWESAAVAAGEIDLITLTEAWGEELTRVCALEYCRTRWPVGKPGEFENRLAAARLYVAFRWLGERPQVTLEENNSFYFEQMRSAGEELGLI